MSLRSLPIPMKNTSLLLLLGNAKRRPSVEPPEAHWVKRHACSGGYRGRRVAPPNRLLSLVTQKRVTFLAFFPTCSYIAKVTPLKLRGGSLRTFVLTAVITYADLLNRPYISRETL
nr:MAG TPA: hypothetical protein [Microviridae sp.]